MKKVKVKIKKHYLMLLIILPVKIMRYVAITNIHLQILTLLYLPSTTLLMQASARELLVPFLTTLVYGVARIRTHDLLSGPVL